MSIFSDFFCFEFAWIGLEDFFDIFIGSFGFLGFTAISHLNTGHHRTGRGYDGAGFYCCIFDCPSN